MKTKSITALRAWGMALLCSLTTLLPAQDLHLSQFYNAPHYINPALTAVDRADIRFMGSYRGQWEQAIFNPYTTFFGAFDMKLYPKYNDRFFWGVGANFAYDYAGDGQLGLAAGNANLSFVYALDKENFLSLGLSAGGGQRSINYNQLTWNEQHNGETFDPNRPSNETFPSDNNTFADFGMGINYHGQKTDKRTRLDVGAAVFHLNQPDQSFYGTEKSPLPMRISLYMRPLVQLSERVDIPLHGIAQFQGPYFEAIAGAGLRFYLNLIPSKEIALELGGSYRFNSIGDAIIPHIQLLYHQWQVGFSYDVNISDFSVATLYRGGPEFSVRYAITKVKPLDKVRVCRLY